MTIALDNVAEYIKKLIEEELMRMGGLGTLAAVLPDGHGALIQTSAGLKPLSFTTLDLAEPKAELIRIIKVQLARACE